MSRREPSFKEYASILLKEKLIHYSGFAVGWLTFMYYWVHLLWDAEHAVIPSIQIGLLVYTVAFLVYDIYGRARKEEYDAVIDRLYQPYWDLVLSVMKGEREKAQKAIDELSAYVPDPGE